MIFILSLMIKLLLSINIFDGWPDPLRRKLIQLPRRARHGILLQSAQSVFYWRAHRRLHRWCDRFRSLIRLIIVVNCQQSPQFIFHLQYQSLRLMINLVGYGLKSESILGSRLQQVQFDFDYLFLTLELLDLLNKLFVTLGHLEVIEGEGAILYNLDDLALFAYFFELALEQDGFQIISWLYGQSAGGSF